jgi:hypothetical protein
VRSIIQNPRLPFLSAEAAFHKPFIGCLHVKDITLPAGVVLERN